MAARKRSRKTFVVSAVIGGLFRIRKKSSLRNFPLAKGGNLRIIADMEQTLRQSLAAIAAAYTEATGIAASTASKRAVNDQMFIGRVIEGSGFTIRTYDRAVQWFSDNWPKHAIWPDGVERPTPATQGAAA